MNNISNRSDSNYPPMSDSEWENAPFNEEDYPTKETCKKLLDIAVKTGCPYFCTNVKVTICNKCGYINKKTENHCTKCGSTDIDYATRVIGYLRRVTNFSKERQEEESRRHYHKE